MPMYQCAAAVIALSSLHLRLGQVEGSERAGEKERERARERERDGDRERERGSERERERERESFTYAGTSGRSNTIAFSGP